MTLFWSAWTISSITWTSRTPDNTRESHIWMLSVILWVGSLFVNSKDMWHFALRKKTWSMKLGGVSCSNDDKNSPVLCNSTVFPVISDCTRLCLLTQSPLHSLPPAKLLYCRHFLDSLQQKLSRDPFSRLQGLLLLFLKLLLSGRLGYFWYSVTKLMLN